MSRFLRRQPDDQPTLRGPAKQRHAASYAPTLEPNQPWPKGVPRPGPSVYAERFRQQGPVTIVMTHRGQWLGVERDGEFEPARPCCTNPLECDRPECWRPFTAGHIE